MYTYRGITSVAAMIGATLVGLAAAPVMAADDLILTVAPGSEFVSPGDTVTVTLDVANVSVPINGVQVLLLYDTTILELVTTGGIPDGIAPNDLVAAGLIVSPAVGWVEINETDTSSDITWAAAINDGEIQLNHTIATLTFTVIDEGTTSVTFRADSPPFATKLTAAAENSMLSPINKVGSGNIVSSCDDGLGCTFDSIVGGFCEHTIEPADTVCRASTGLCDLAELCDGVSGACPADVIDPVDTVCRPSTGPCDPAEVCDGSSPACPADVIDPFGTVCRPSTGPCDPQETCDGLTIACPPDTLKPAGAVCRPSSDLCDAAESCDGVSVSCPVDAVEPAGTVCRASSDLCDAAESCDGVLVTCPADALEPAGTPCSDGFFCNGLETCDTFGVCLPSSDPCTPSPCDEVNDVCLSLIHVAGLEVFYAGRFLDQADPSRVFLASGSTATTGNITNYANGITGIRVTFDDVVVFATTAADAFSFEWTFPTDTIFSPVTNAATAITVTSVVLGGVTVVEIVLADNHVRQRWLKVTLDAAQVTVGGVELDGDVFGNPVGLPSGDGTPGGDTVFFLGNMPGEVTGNRGTTLTDVGQIRLQVNPAFQVPIDNLFDVDKSGKVRLGDVGLARLDVNPAFQLPLISP